MCMILGNVSPAGGIVATDTRMQFEDRSYQDNGGKLIATAAGWVTSSGAALPAIAGLEAAVFAHAHGTGQGLTVEESFRRYFQDRGIPTAAGTRHEGARTYVIQWTAGRPRLTVFRNNATATAPGNWAAVALPHGYPEPMQDARMTAVFADMKAAPEDMAARVRIAAHHFAEVAARSEAQSDVMEAGLLLPPQPGESGPRRLFLRGRAADIARTPTRDVFATYRADEPTRPYTTTEELAA